MNNLISLYNEIKTRFSRNNIENADKEARILLKHIFDISDVDFIIDKDLSDNIEKKIILDEYIEKRLSSVPLSKILGVNEFWGMEFEVSKDTLDPRPDTEFLIERILKWADKDKKYKILDIGTGTACIIISLLKELPNSSGVAVDISRPALDIAKNNISKHDLLDRIILKESDYFSNIDEKFDIIVSNPPYIKTEIIPNLSNEVKNHDPILALDGGGDGLFAYKKIIKDAKKYLNLNGMVFLEIGYDQKNDIMRLVKNSEVNRASVHPDYSGNARVVEISYGDK